ncbi:NLI interacting factor-like phosphatase [Nitzschia inconspicua]|uniref:NLI interacting factor-like phosphatase n=1 Tax=Nitzschia inconspicua TaxID=303405 RepID=A0A9K3LHQ5_9STRA|nr:NLI interacting factor-like phosphatase [Nitzschia inconspicua]
MISLDSPSAVLNEQQQQQQQQQHQPKKDDDDYDGLSSTNRKRTEILLPPTSVVQQQQQEDDVKKDCNDCVVVVDFVDVDHWMVLPGSIVTKGETVTMTVQKTIPINQQQQQQLQLPQPTIEEWLLGPSKNVCILPFWKECMSYVENDQKQQQRPYPTTTTTIPNNNNNITDSLLQHTGPNLTQVTVSGGDYHDGIPTGRTTSATMGCNGYRWCWIWTILSYMPHRMYGLEAIWDTIPTTTTRRTTTLLLLVYGPFDCHCMKGQPIPLYNYNNHHHHHHQQQQQQWAKQHYVKLRPHVNVLLRGIESTYEVSVYTAGTKQYYAEEVTMVLCRNLVGSSRDWDGIERLRYQVQVLQMAHHHHHQQQQQRINDTSRNNNAITMDKYG